MLACLLVCGSARAGILIYRSEQGVQFTDAVAITVNGKDKVLSLGNQPIAGAAVSKQSAAHLAKILLKDGDAGVLLQYEPGNADYLLPEGLPKNAPDDPAAAWKTARIAYKQSASDKAGTEVSFASFVAFLPAGAGELAALCKDAAALQLIGGKGKNFSTQVELMSAAAKAYATDPAMVSLAKYVADAMRGPYEAFENGAGGIEVLRRGLDVVPLSQAVYPNSPEQEKLRQLLTGRKAWLDRKIAVQKAFAAAAQWDVFLLGARGLARYQAAFPEIAADHRQALQGSLQLHLKLAAARQSEGDYGEAYREFQLAILRKPSDSVLRERAMQAWTEYSRRNAMDLQAKRTKLGAGPQSTVERALYFADQNKREKKLDEALKSVQDAETALRTSQPAGSVSGATMKVWYAEADILAAQDRIAEALAALDTYDLHAVDEERAPAEALRNQLLFSLNTSLKNLKTSLQAAWSEGSFSMAYRLAAQGLRMDSEDAELLYYAGMAALIRRQPKQSHDLLAHYLEASDNLDANDEQRALVSRLLPSIAAPTNAAEGDPNWLSGEKLPKGVFYSPVSLAFGPRIDRIDASNKFHVAFEWDGDRLKSIKPSFENAGHATGEKAISFGYEDHVPQVVWASDSGRSPPARAGRSRRSVQARRRAAAQQPVRGSGRGPAHHRKEPGAGYRGQPVLQPVRMGETLLLPDRLRRQRASQPRPATERPHGYPRRAGTRVRMERDATDRHPRLSGNDQELRAHACNIEDGRLVAEEIQGQGKPAHIKYNYAGDRLVSADATTDPTLDNRNRKVTFLGELTLHTGEMMRIVRSTGRRKSVWLNCALLFLAALAPALHAQETGKRIALIIGNDAYPISPLKNAVNDARAMDKALKSSGFQTIALENAKKADMDRADRRVSGQARPRRYRPVLFRRPRGPDRKRELSGAGGFPLGGDDIGRQVRLHVGSPDFR